MLQRELVVTALEHRDLLDLRRHESPQFSPIKSTGRTVHSQTSSRALHSVALDFGLTGGNAPITMAHGRSDLDGSGAGPSPTPQKAVGNVLGSATQTGGEVFVKESQRLQK